MKIKLTFEKMKEFVDNVVNDTLELGEVYKDILIDYYTARFYHDVDFGTSNIVDIYNNQYDKLMTNINKNNIDEVQYEYIKKVIDNDLARKSSYLAASMVMSDANIAITNLVNQISDVVTKIDESIDIEQVEQMMKVFGDIKDNVNADTLIKAMADNKLINTKRSTKSDKNKTVKNNSKPNIEISSNKEGN